jgi:hypothetical protein
MAVRTFGKVSILAVNTVGEDNSFQLKPHIVQTIVTPSDPMHVSFNPFISYEAAFVCSDGSVRTWNLERGEEDAAR